MANPLVTVFIPVYNCESYIAESLDSILNQTYQHLEILLVDDGSTDRSVDIIEQYEDVRIKLIRNAANMGIPYTRNVGLEEASGKYIAIMDSDDIAVPERIEKQVHFLEENEDIDAAGSFYIKFNDKSNRRITASYTSPEAIKVMLIFFNPVANPSAMIRRQTLVEQNLWYNPNYFVSQDYDLWVQLSKTGRIGIIPEYLLFYRSGHDNITKQSKHNKTEKRKHIINAIHADILNYYKINLAGDELDIFNEFFSYNYGAIDDTSTLSDVLVKLKTWNEQANVFDEELFAEVLDTCIITGLSNQQIGLIRKLSLFRQHIQSRRSKDLLYIIAKHIYYRIKK